MMRWYVFADGIGRLPEGMYERMRDNMESRCMADSLYNATTLGKASPSDVTGYGGHLFVSNVPPPEDC